MPFTTSEVEFEITEADSGAVVIVRISTPIGSLACMAELVEEDQGRTLRTIGLHVDDETLGPNGLGVAGLRDRAGGDGKDGLRCDRR